MSGQDERDGDAAACPDPARRAWLRGGVLAAAGGAAVAGGLAGCAAERPEASPAARAPDAGVRQAWPFLGRHQSGITTPTQAAAIVAAFDLVGNGRAVVERALRLLGARIAFLTAGGVVPARDPRLPPLDSGVLGAEVYPDGLTVTVSVGATLFDARFGLSALRPRQLVEMPSFRNDALDAARCDGDVLLQICANTAETNIHALRDIIKHLSGTLAPRWTLHGFLPPHTVQALGRDSVVNLMGFRDGTANPDAGDAAGMDRLVWVQPGSGEPAWAAHGSYQVVRIIRNFVEFWDRTPLREQERIIGRHKASGAPLGKTREHDPVDYAGDPQGLVTPLDAHIRLANPRTPDARQILRRSFNYSAGLTRAGQLDMGLLFVCYQSDLDAGFVAMQKRLDGEPLEEYIKPVGGGFYFALPGAPEAGGYPGRGLVESG